MAITKNTTYDMEIIGESPTISVQVRTKDVYVEDGVEISTTYLRHVIHAIDDWSSEPQKVQNFCDAFFTDAIISEYGAWIRANEPKPYFSWTMKSGRWTPPVAKPDDGKAYEWNEDTQAWDEL